jgi:hypothetical protein
MSRDSQTIETLLARAFNEVEASRYTGMSISFLRQLRMKGVRKSCPPGPPFVKVGRAVRYLRDDLDTWLESYRQEPRHGGE